MKGTFAIISTGISIALWDVKITSFTLSCTYRMDVVYMFKKVIKIIRCLTIHCTQDAAAIPTGATVQCSSCRVSSVHIAAAVACSSHSRTAWDLHPDLSDWFI